MKRGINHLVIFLSIVLLTFTSACKSPGVDEGILVYGITYVEAEKASKPVIDLLPDEMRQIFKDSSSKSMIEGFMGMFLTAYISNQEKKSNSLIFKVFADKHYCETAFDESALGFDPVEGVRVELMDDETELLGLNVSKARIFSHDSSFNDFEILYTKDIAIANPNWNNPYKEIDGVLLDFRVKMKGITMFIKLKEVLNQEVDPVEFVVPEGYKKVIPDSLNAIIENLMNNAQ